MGFRVDTSAFEELELMLLRGGEAAEKMAEPMLRAGAQKLIDAQKAELSRMVKTNRSIGTLRNSIGAGRIKKSKSGTGIHIGVFPQGNQPHGHPRKGKRGMVPNAQVGFVLNYGRSNMPGTRWMDIANDKAADAVNNAIAAVWEEAQSGQ